MKLRGAQQQLNMVRKHYILQFFAVAVVLFFAVCLAFVFLERSLCVLIFGTSVMLFYLMGREIKNSLQLEGERLCFETFENSSQIMQVDFGNGVDVYIPAFVEENNISDVFNALVFSNGGIAEVRLFVAISSKFLRFDEVKFEGILWQPQGLSLTQIDEIMEKLKVFFRAKRVVKDEHEGKIFVWVETGQHLYYQFGFYARNGEVVAFRERIKQIADMLKISL